MSVEEKLEKLENTANPPTAGTKAVSQATHTHVGMTSIIASIVSTFLIRVASRVSFVILSFYVGKESESATMVVVVIEAYYVTELLLAPVIGVLSDAKGRKRYMAIAPIFAAAASFIMAVTSFIFPRPHLSGEFNFELLAILGLILTGRLLEGAAAAYNAPSSLGYLADVTVHDEKLRVRVLTGYQVATVAGLALAIPFGGQVWGALGRLGFFVAIALYGLCFVTIAVWMKESLVRTNSEGEHGSIKEYREILTNKRIFTFVPAWLAINAMLGAWLTLLLIVLAYPTSQCHIKVTNVAPGIKNAVSNFAAGFCALEPGQMDADKRFPNQLLHGGFLPTEASTLVGLFGVIFILSMGLWTIFVPKLRRTTTMMISLVGMMLSVVALYVINAQGDNPMTVESSKLPLIFGLLALAVLGVVGVSGFTPAALTHLAAIAETLPGKRGAVMGLYSVLLGVGQLIGVFIGGLAVDWQGFNGLMYYSAALAVVALGSVWYMRSHRHDIDDHLNPALAAATHSH